MISLIDSLKILDKIKSILHNKEIIHYIIHNLDFCIYSVGYLKLNHNKKKRFEKYK